MKFVRVVRPSDSVGPPRSIDHRPVVYDDAGMYACYRSQRVCAPTGVGDRVRVRGAPEARLCR